MALDYLSYQQNVKSPLEMALAGYQFGAQIKQQQAQREQLQQQAMQQQAMQQDLANLSSKQNPTADDYRQIITKYPNLATNFKDAMANATEEQNKVRQTDALNLYSAISSGNTDMAKSLLERRLEAAKNSGNQQEIDTSQSILQMIDLNPDAAKVSAGLFLSSTMGHDKFADTLSKLQEVEQKRALQQGELEKQQGELLKQAYDLGLTGAQTSETMKRTEKLDLETQKLALELEAQKSGDQPIDPEKKFNMEEKLRNNYQKNTANLNDAQAAYDVLSISAKDNSGAGDVALVTSFMKVLDPGSVVRETEFATARDTAGLYSTLEGYLSKIKGGQFLTPEQRKTFANLSKKYLEAAQGRAKQVQADMEFPIKNYGLNRENVFGTAAGGKAKLEETTQTQQPKRLKFDAQGNLIP